MLVFSRIFRPPPIKFFVFAVRTLFLSSVIGAAGVHFDLPQIQRLHRVEDEVGEMVRRYPVAQIRREQQRSVAIDIYETSGHELLVAFPGPSSGLVSKRPPAFSFSSLSGTARRATRQIFFYDAIPASKSDRLLGAAALRLL